MTTTSAAVTTSIMLRALMSAYPWDLIDDDLDAVLDRLNGEIGVSGLSVWAALPPQTRLRPRAVQPRLFRTRGGLFFHADADRYASTRCKPAVSHWVKAKRPLRRIADAVAERGMELRLAVSAARTGRLALQHPDMSCKNLFGSPSNQSVCLANPDVQAFLVSLVTELSEVYAPAAVTVSDFHLVWTEAFERDLVQSVPLDDGERTLLSVCFCESCRQGATQAGVDVAGAHQVALSVVQEGLQRGAPSERSLADHLLRGGVLEAYFRWRDATLSALLDRLVEGCSSELILDRPLAGPLATQHGGIDIESVSALMTRIERPAELDSASHGGAVRREVRLATSLALPPRAQELVAALSSVSKLGLSAVEIGDYGLLPDAAMVGIKQAIRMARRATTD